MSRQAILCFLVFIKGKKIIKCPALLNAVCPYCRGKGHTMKNCELKQRDDANIARGWKERERERKRIEFEEKSKQVSVKNTSVKSRSVFSALEESSSDEESSAPAPIQKETKKSYKDMAATIKEEPAPIIEEEIKEELQAPIVPKKKSILERLREPMPAAPAPAPKKGKEAIRLARKEAVAKYKAEGKQIPWAIYDEYNTDSDSDDECA